MISPIAIDAAFDLEFDSFAAELFGDLHLSLFRAGRRLFVLPRGRLVVNPGFVYNHVCATKDIIRNPPLLPQIFQRRCIYDEMNGDFVDDWYLSRISSTQNSRRQFPRLPADLVKISAVIEQRPAIRFTWSDAEHWDAGSPPDQNYRICRNTDRDIAADP